MREPERRALQQAAELVCPSCKYKELWNDPVRHPAYKDMIYHRESPSPNNYAPCHAAAIINELIERQAARVLRPSRRN